MKLLLLLTLSIVFISCNFQPKKAPIKANHKNEYNQMLNSKKDTSHFNDLMILTKLEAIKKYGTPIKREKFILNDGPIEFRIELLNHYSKEKIMSNSIVIKELTWEKDKNTWITVWYEVFKNESIPKDTLTWEKGTEF